MPYTFADGTTQFSPPATYQNGSVVGYKKRGQLRRLFTLGLSRLHAALLGAYAFGSRLGGTADLGCFSQLLEETEHFCGRGQEKVAKIVQCGEH